MRQQKITHYTYTMKQGRTQYTQHGETNVTILITQRTVCVLKKNSPTDII